MTRTGLLSPSVPLATDTWPREQPSTARLRAVPVPSGRGTPPRAPRPPRHCRHE
jgi:hypothetical protein